MRSFGSTPLLAAALLLGGSLALGQDAPAPEAPEPEDDEEGPEVEEEDADDYDPAAPGEEVRVERLDELERVQAELERIRAQRERLADEEARIAAQVEALSERELSPVVAPRRTVLRLTLDESIGLALRNNPDYLVALLQARAASEGVPEAVGAFDPTVSVQATYGEARPPFFSSNPFSGLPPGLQTASSTSLTVSTAIEKRFLLGTTVRVTWDESRRRTENQFALNPSYTPALGVEVTQPLLRGFGIDVNEAGIVLAELDALSNEAAYAQTLMDAVLAVEQAYWSVVQAEEDLRAQERSLSSALKFLEDQRTREEAGAAAPLDIVVAQAGVASRREGVIRAENALEATRDQLLRLVRPSSDPEKWNVFVVPVDRPTIVDPPEAAVGRALAQARERRPDYYQAQLAIDSARRTLLLRENEALPALDAIATFREEGLGGQHHNAWTALASGRFYSWTAGVRLSLPLFLRSERARARSARLALEQAEAQLEALDATVILEIRSALRDVHTAEARIEATRDSRILTARRLDASRTQVELGTAVPRDVLDDLADLALAESAEITARINYRLAITRLEQVQGVLLDRWLDVLDPGVRRALERESYQYYGDFGG